MTIRDGVYKICEYLLGKSWTKLTLKSGIGVGSYGGSRNTPSYRTAGSQVIIEGSVSISNFTEATLIATLPADLKPVRHHYAIVAVSGSNVARMIVKSDGGIWVEWIKKLSDGSNVTGSISWVQISTSYYID